MSVTVTLVRHGETGGNVFRVLQGQMDNCLSVKGIHQAELLGLKLARDHEVITRAFTSDLIRAHRTLYNATKQLDSFEQTSVRYDERLRERHFGVAQGKPIADYKAWAVESGFQLAEYYLLTPKGAESYDAFVSRIESFLNDIFKLADNAKTTGIDENVLIVSHGSWLTACMRYLNNNPDKFKLINFDPKTALLTPNNTGLTRFKIGTADSGKRVLAFSDINNVLHLTCDCECCLITNLNRKKCLAESETCSLQRK